MEVNEGFAPFTLYVLAFGVAFLCGLICLLVRNKKIYNFFKFCFILFFALSIIPGIQFLTWYSQRTGFQNDYRPFAGVVATFMLALLLFSLVSRAGHKKL